MRPTLRPLWWPVLNLRHTVQPIRTTDDHRSRKGRFAAAFPNIQESYRISLRIHHNVENTGCHAATQHLFVDWDMTPLRQCSQRCSAGYGSGEPLPQRGVLRTDYRLLVVPAVYVCEARCLSSGCFKELHFITTVRVLRRDSNPLPNTAISDVAKYPYLLCWCG